MTMRSEALIVVALSAALAACGSPGPRPNAAPRTSSLAARASAPVVEHSQDADARFKAALDLMKARQFEPARAAFVALSRDFPEFSGPLTNLGILYAKDKQRDAAVESLSRAVDANPRNAVALNWLGILYRESGAYARAEEAYLRALTVRDDYAPATLNLAILYDVFLHRPDAALTRYRAYQQLTGGDNLIVAAWIRDLESPAVSSPIVTAELRQ
jgi:tetratricopeptide (TPR) repeat protein